MWHAREAEQVHTGFWWGNLRERDNLEGLGVDGRKILICTKVNVLVTVSSVRNRDRAGAMDWIDLVRDRDRWLDRVMW